MGSSQLQLHTYHLILSGGIPLIPHRNYIQNISRTQIVLPLAGTMKPPNLDKELKFVRRIYENCKYCEAGLKTITYLCTLFEGDIHHPIRMMPLCSECGHRFNQFFGWLGIALFIRTNFEIPFRDIQK